MSDLQPVAVLGGTRAATDLAALVAASGRQVTLLHSGGGTDAAALARAVDDAVARGVVPAERRAAALGLTRQVTDPAALAGCRLVIEAVAEDRDRKHAVLAEASAAVAADAHIVTTTATSSVTDLATAVTAPGRFGGLHFFSDRPLVEVVRAVHTSADTVEDLTAFVETVGRTAVVVKDQPGFLVGHLLMPYLNDVIQELDNGLASAEDIDTALRLGLGYELGPLEMLDRIGLDVHEHATRSAYEATLDPVFAPPPLLRRLVAAGHRGNENGRGFRTGEEE